MGGRKEKQGRRLSLRAPQSALALKFVGCISDLTKDISFLGREIKEEVKPGYLKGSLQAVPPFLQKHVRKRNARNS